MEAESVKTEKIPEFLPSVTNTAGVWSILAIF